MKEYLLFVLAVWLERKGKRALVFSSERKEDGHKGNNFKGREKRNNNYPTNFGIARGTLSVATLVAVSDGGQHLGCCKGFFHYSNTCPGKLTFK